MMCYLSCYRGLGSSVSCDQPRLFMQLHSVGYLAGAILHTQCCILLCLQQDNLDFLYNMTAGAKREHFERACPGVEKLTMPAHISANHSGYDLLCLLICNEHFLCE